ncbi:hypothetical protein Droror1_Dr00016410, partial [Drosera rotundifolia]
TPHEQPTTTRTPPQSISETKHTPTAASLLSRKIKPATTACYSDCLTPQPKDQAGDDGPRLRLPHSSAGRSSRRRSSPRLRRRRPVTPVRLALGDSGDDTTTGGDDEDEEKVKRGGGVEG